MYDPDSVSVKNLMSLPRPLACSRCVAAAACVKSSSALALDPRRHKREEGAPRQGTEAEAAVPKGAWQLRRPLLLGAAAAAAAARRPRRSRRRRRIYSYSPLSDGSRVVQPLAAARAGMASHQMSRRAGLEAARHRRLGAASGACPMCLHLLRITAAAAGCCTAGGRRRSGCMLRVLPACCCSLLLAAPALAEVARHAGSVTARRRGCCSREVDVA